jgi:hypothetical protein
MTGFPPVFPSTLAYPAFGNSYYRSFWYDLEAPDRKAPEHRV